VNTGITKPLLPESPLTLAGRTFSAEQLRLVRQLLANHPHLSRHELAATVCELLDWRRPNGRLKTREARDLLQQLAERGALRLPEKRAGRPAGASRRLHRGDPPSRPPLTLPLRTLQPIRLLLAKTPQQRQHATELLEQYHYLGYRTPFGAHLRYLIQTAEPTPQTLGVLQYSSPAWRMQARDQWIGWDKHTRRKKLQHLVSQSRFLLLPWVQIKHLASHVLALSARQLPTDWLRHYHVRPLLLETLVDEQHYRGTCYRAANWIDVGQTTGRGRMDHTHQRHGSAPKRIFLYPLVHDARSRLVNAEGKKRLQING
jgi:hypothetical protein